MPLYMTDQISSPAAYMDTEFFNDAGKSLPLNYRNSDATQMEINRIQVGRTVYPLRRSLTATFVPGLHRGQLVVDSMSPAFVGYGESGEDALQDWALQVHAAFQDLIAKRPFEMNADDRRRWNLLRDMIDVTVFRNTTPVVVRQFGRVTQLRPWPQQVEWANGQKEPVSLMQVDSPDFITYKAGQPFEAVVERNPLTGELLRISHIERRRKIQRMRPQQEAELLHAIGSSERMDTVEL